MSNYHIASLLRFYFSALNKFLDQELYIFSVNATQSQLI